MALVRRREDRASAKAKINTILTRSALPCYLSSAALDRKCTGKIMGMHVAAALNSSTSLRRRERNLRLMNDIRQRSGRRGQSGYEGECAETHDRRTCDS